MAKAKKKTTKQTNKKKTTNKNKNTQSNQMNYASMAIKIGLIVVALIAIGRFGTLGSLLYQFVQFFVGALVIPFLLVVVVVLGYRLIKPDGFVLSMRYWIGILLVCIGISLLLGILEFRPNKGFYGLQFTLKHFLPILKAEFSTVAGVLGCILLGIFSSLIDYIGCYFVVIVGIVLGAVLICWDWINDLWEEQKEYNSKKPKKQKKSIRESAKENLHARNQKKLERQYEEQRQYEEEQERQSIFLDYDPSLEPKQSSLFISADDIASESKEITIPEPKVTQTQVDEMYMEEEIVPEEKPKPKRVSKPKEEPKEEIVEVSHYVDQHIEDYSNYKLPALRTVLEGVSRRQRKDSNVSNAKEQGAKLIQILNEFGVGAKLVDIHIGPSVTKFEIRPDLGVRVSKISNLQYDIKMALAATDIRIEAPIPGKSAVGIEIPNETKTSVQMMELMSSIPAEKENPLLFCLGKDLTGQNVYGELNKMPHLLIAGATGSGKSVCVNSIISTILMRTKPDQVKMVLIDPKKVEFTPYKDVPHLLAPVITDAEMANKALKVVVKMMDDRYELFGQLGVRNIQAYNQFYEQHKNDEGIHLKPLPWLVVIIDELADLMLVAAKEVEGSVQRITQLARAAGIHLIVATQRPSVDVITGVIKANIPSRIAFAVSSAVDSRTILDQVGAERLLGYGDMLYLPNGETAPKRVQGVFIKDDEVNKIAEYVKSQAKPRYDDTFIGLIDLQNQGQEVSSECSDPLYDEVKRFVIQSRRASTSLIQRKFSIGYSRAARLIDVLEEHGIIGPANGSKPREILVQNTLEDFNDSL